MRDVGSDEIAVKSLECRSIELCIYFLRYRAEARLFSLRDANREMCEWAQQRAREGVIGNEILDLRRHIAQRNARRRDTALETTVEQRHRLIDHRWQPAQAGDDVLVILNGCLR